MLCATGAPLLDRDRADAGQRRRRAFGRERRHVADDEQLGMPGHRAVRADDDAAGAVERHAQRRGERARPHARAPQHRRRPAASRPRPARRAASIGSTRTPVRTSTPSSRSCVRARARTAADRTASGSDRPSRPAPPARPCDRCALKSTRQDVARQIGDRAGQLDARGPAAHHHEGEQRAGARPGRRRAPPPPARAARGGEPRARRRGP